MTEKKCKIKNLTGKNIGKFIEQFKRYDCEMNEFNGIRMKKDEKLVELYFYNFNIDIIEQILDK